MSKVICIAGILVLGILLFGFSLHTNGSHLGEDLYKKFQCIACHGSKGTSPFNLTDAKEDYTYDNLKRYIDNPRAFGNQKMPVFKGLISDKEYRDLTSYIIQLRKNAQRKN